MSSRPRSKQKRSTTRSRDSAGVSSTARSSKRPNTATSETSGLEDESSSQLCSRYDEHWSRPVRFVEGIVDPSLRSVVPDYFGETTTLPQVTSDTGQAVNSNCPSYLYNSSVGHDDIASYLAEPDPQPPEASWASLVSRYLTGRAPPLPILGGTSKIESQSR